MIYDTRNLVSIAVLIFNCNFNYFCDQPLAIVATGLMVVTQHFIKDCYY